MLTFKPNYFVIAVFLFVVEVLIALYIHDNFIRPYAGDFLVVILLYCALKSFINWSEIKSAISVLLFSYLIETLQYFNLVKHMGLAENKLANIIIGTYFTWVDIFAYSLGILVVLGIEQVKIHLQRNSIPDETFQYFI